MTLQMVHRPFEGPMGGGGHLHGMEFLTGQIGGEDQLEGEA